MNVMVKALTAILVMVAMVSCNDSNKMVGQGTNGSGESEETSIKQDEGMSQAHDVVDTALYAMKSGSGRHVELTTVKELGLTGRELDPDFEEKVDLMDELDVSQMHVQMDYILKKVLLERHKIKELQALRRSAKIDKGIAVVEMGVGTPAATAGALAVAFRQNLAMQAIEWEARDAVYRKFRELGAPERTAAYNEAFEKALEPAMADVRAHHENVKVSPKGKREIEALRAAYRVNKGEADRAIALARRIQSGEEGLFRMVGLNGVLYRPEDLLKMDLLRKVDDAFFSGLARVVAADKARAAAALVPEFGTAKDVTRLKVFLEAQAEGYKARSSGAHRWARAKGILGFAGLATLGILFWVDGKIKYVTSAKMIEEMGPKLDAAEEKLAMTELTANHFLDKVRGNTTFNGEVLSQETIDYITFLSMVLKGEAEVTEKKDTNPYEEQIFE